MDSLLWKELAEKKEKEWRDVLEARIESQEAALKDREKELQTQREQFNELKDHFKYNLKLLEERDKELEKYDVTFGELRLQLNQKNAELSEVKIHIDDLKNVIKREEKTREELQANYQRRLREKQAEVDQYKSSKDQEVQDEREEYEQFRRALQLQLTSVQSELETQKRELTTEFENELKKREHEFRVETDELKAKVLEHDLRAKLLEKELDLFKESNDKTYAQAQEAETSQRELEKLLKQKEWELADVSAVKDSKISELENKLSTAEANMKKMQEDFQRKYTEMDKLSREREETVERAKNGYLAREGALQSTIQELQSKLEDAQIRERQLTWTNQDLMKEKDVQIEKMQEEVRDIKERWDRHVSEISRSHVSRDLELSSALEEQRRLKLELEQRKEDLERYKMELRQASEREQSLDKAKTQVELDWQRRCEELESQQFDKAEDLIKTLTTARNEAQALVKEREREFQHQILLVKSLHRERDQLRALLKKNDIPLDNFVKYSLEEAESREEEISYIEDLQNQNAGLRQLIAQMRSQMESLGQVTPSGEGAELTGSDPFLKDEVQRLRRENRELQEKLRASKRAQISSAHTVTDSEEVMKQVEGNVHVKTHILSLNETIGTLRTEKVELAATVKKQQARLAHLEHSLEELSKQPRQKQIQIDQLTYELSSQKRRHEGESTGLKNRVMELELQLSEARREADEYHRASLERNQEVVALGNQLSAMKMEVAAANPSINFGAQELYIQQLQGELSQLRKRATALEASDMDTISAKFATLGHGGDKSDLKYKLKSAAAKIVQLAKENQHLIESNNKLRAQLKSAVLNQDASKKPEISSKSVTISEDTNKFPSYGGDMDSAGRLSQLEKLQYQLTKQELQFARRFNSQVPPTGMSMASEVSLPERDIIAVPDGKRSPVPRSASREPMDPKMLMSMSSGGGESINKVWQMLEESVTSGDLPSSSPPSPRAVMAEQAKAKESNKQSKEDKFQIQGQPVSPASRPARKQIVEKPVQDPRKLVKPKMKVRNYNVRDS